MHDLLRDARHARWRRCRRLDGPWPAFAPAPCQRTSRTPLATASHRSTRPRLSLVELSAREDANRRMLRARDEMDRRYAEPLDLPSLAAVAHLSVPHFARVFKQVYGETPHRYLQRRRVERAMTLLRQSDRAVTDVAWDVGFASLGTFSSTFGRIVGCSPSAFRARHGPVAVPSCFVAAWTRPRGDARPPAEAIVSEKQNRSGSA